LTDAQKAISDETSFSEALDRYEQARGTRFKLRSAVDDHAVVEVHRDGPGEHQPLDVAPHTLELADTLAMIDTNDFPVDDRPVVEVLDDIVGRRADQLDASLTRTPVGGGARERREERVVDV
jgi:hypothetical protein